MTHTCLGAPKGWGVDFPEEITPWVGVGAVLLELRVE